MSGHHTDDRSPMSARRKMRVGYLEDHSSEVSLIVETDRDEVWGVTRDRAICWPKSDPGQARTWPLILADWLEVDWPLSLTLLNGGREVRSRDLGVVVRITVEQRHTR